MKTKLKFKAGVILAILSYFFPVAGNAGCNDANGNLYTLTVNGPEYVVAGSTNYYSLSVTNDANNQAVSVNAANVSWSLPSGFSIAKRKGSVRLIHHRSDKLLLLVDTAKCF